MELLVNGSRSPALIWSIWRRMLNRPHTTYFSREAGSGHYIRVTKDEDSVLDIQMVVPEDFF